MAKVSKPRFMLFLAKFTLLKEKDLQEKAGISNLTLLHQSVQIFNEAVVEAIVTSS